MPKMHPAALTSVLQASELKKKRRASATSPQASRQGRLLRTLAQLPVALAGAWEALVHPEED